MPNLGLHIGFAIDAAARLGHPLTKRYRGSYLLGCTTPDIRLFAGWDRDRTHFFNLASDQSGSGLRRLFETHPHLAKSQELTGETVAFMLGYFCHLNIDEAWICEVYRRHFGPGSALAADPLVLVLDRVLQFEMDRAERANIVDLEGELRRIQGACAGVSVGFIDEQLLQQWQEMALTRLGRELPWERFQGYVKRVRPQADEAEVARIAADVPSLLEKVRAYVPLAEIERARESAIQAFVSAARGYLAESSVA